MAETLVEKKVCEACGADVRPGSMFCYNCGGAVDLELIEAEKNSYKTTQLKKEKIENFADRPIAKPTVGELLEKIEEKPIEKPVEKSIENPFEKASQEEAKLKSAANLRRKAKSFQRKTVEVVWEEPEAAPNKWFPIVAIVLILFVVAIFYLAMYLK